MSTPLLSAESYKVVLESVSNTLHGQVARQEGRTARAQWEHAAGLMREADVKERHYELASLAAQYVGKGKAFEAFGKLTDRERQIAIAASHYVQFGRAKE